jgi:hypothetical protein
MPNSNKNVERPASHLIRVAISDLRPDPRNPRKHSREQIRAIARSIESFGFNAPVLVNKEGQIIAGHGRYEAAKVLGYPKIPVIRLDHLNEAQSRAYMLADNKLTDRSSWEDATLAVHLKELSELALEFEIEATGFEPPEIDFRIQSLEEADIGEKADEFQLASGPAVSAQGGLWFLGDHRVYCGSALDTNAYKNLFEGEDRRATAVFTDPPYNVAIDGHATGNGRITHREFPMASGEMSETEFTDFLKGSFTHIAARGIAGALIYVCMDWRHMMELHSAGQAAEWDLVNLCVWAKSNGGMGSLYRSRHELIFVFRNGNNAT